MAFPDHFSGFARDYAHYRPHYPAELFAYLAACAPARALAWDCGTGNGQAALGLARRCQRIIATDASPDQIAHAHSHAKIEYRVEPAESTALAALAATSSRWLWPCTGSSSSGSTLKSAGC